MNGCSTLWNPFTVQLGTILMVALFWAGCRGELSSVRVYYVPMNAETYAAVTPESINEERVCRLRTRDVATLRGILSSATPLDAGTQFDPNRVRVKIVEQVGASPVSVLVDKEGVVSRPEGQFRLSMTARQKLKKVIEHAFDSE